MVTMEELANAVQALQTQVVQHQQENQELRARVTNYEAQAAQAAQAAAQAVAISPQHSGGMAAEVLDALRSLPEALGKLNRPKGLIDPRGLGKPQMLGEDAEQKFRLWAIKLEDYVSGVFGGRSRETLEWAAEMETEITAADIDSSFGALADLNAL